MKLFLILYAGIVLGGLIGYFTAALMFINRSKK